MLGVTRRGYEKHKKSQIKSPKHVNLLAAIQAIIKEDECNDRYGVERIRDALILRGHVVCLSTVYRKNGIGQIKPKGLTKSEKDATIC